MHPDIQLKNFNHTLANDMDVDYKELNEKEKNFDLEKWSSSFIPIENSVGNLDSGSEKNPGSENPATENAADATWRHALVPHQTRPSGQSPVKFPTVTTARQVPANS